MPNAAQITVYETLALLDTSHGSFSAGVAEDRYAFWLGSGISRGRVDDLRRLVLRVLRFLQTRIVQGDDQCRHRRALTEALRLSLTEAEVSDVDFSLSVDDWPAVEQIVDRLLSHYEKLLAVGVDGEDADYLVWEGVDVPGTFADPTSEPDVEHYCICVLALEGVASDIQSANWDELIEIAARELCADESVVTVCVRPEDLRSARRRARLIKFHGCAARARDDERTYRSLLIARHPQIHSWVSNPANAAIVDHLVATIVSKPTLMIGLSAQDANILNIFGTASAKLSWAWPGDRPAYVFAEDGLGADQKGLLEYVYKGSYTPDTRQEILEGATVRAYAKPLLAALVLDVWRVKLHILLKQTEVSTFSSEDQEAVASGLAELRRLAAESLDPLDAEAARRMIRVSSLALSLFQEGQPPTSDLHYRPLTATPTQSIQDEPNLPQSGLRELSVALALVGWGARESLWAIVPTDGSDASRGAMALEAGVGRTRLFFVANGQAALRLLSNEVVEEADVDVVMIYGQDAPLSMARSPSGPRGRTGRSRNRTVSIPDLLVSVDNAESLLQRFREEAAL